MFAVLLSVIAAGGDDAMVMLQFTLAVWSPVVPVESTTLAVKLNVPAMVGDPVMAPVAGFSNRLGGNDPAVMEKVYGDVPPLATNDEL